MTAASAAWPGSRALLGWWRQLASHQPTQMWVAHFNLHRLEALVEVLHREPVPALHLALLRQVQYVPCANPPDLPPLDPQLATQMAQQLLRDGLLNESRQMLSLTSSGEQALAEGWHEKTYEERRVFYFLDRGDQQKPPLFLGLDHPMCSPVLQPSAWEMDVAAIQRCIDEEEEWKKERGFPTDVKAVVTFGAAGSRQPSWRRVVLDAAEDLWMVLIRTEKIPGLTCAGFGVQSGSWSLQGNGPVLGLSAGLALELGLEEAELPLSAWQQAWQTWCQPRCLPWIEVNACRVEHQGHFLLIHAPGRLVERLRQARSDAVREEAWLLAGQGNLRQAALVQLVEGTLR